MNVALTQDAVLIVFALAMMVTDWRWRRIPNVVTYPTMVVGLVLAAFEAFPGELLKGGLLDHVVATIAILLFLFPLYSMRLMLAGDVKLLMGVGAIGGTAFLFWAFVYGSIIGGLVAIVVLTAGKLRGVGFREGLKAYIPYGVSLALGSLVALAVGVAR